MKWHNPIREVFQYSLTFCWLFHVGVSRRWALFTFDPGNSTYGEHQRHRWNLWHDSQFRCSSRAGPERARICTQVTRSSWDVFTVPRLQIWTHIGISQRLYVNNKILLHVIYHLPLRSHLCHVSLMKNSLYLLLLSCFSSLGNSLRHVGSALSDRAVITSRDCYDTITTQTNNA